jgi:gliding motility-associated-like protein
LKRILLLSSFLFVVLAAQAAESGRYWVGGSGHWSESAHWSDRSGGKGGAGVPRTTDNVYFDNLSFTAVNQQVILSDSAFCKNFIWEGSLYLPAFASAGPKPVLSVYGSFAIPDQKHLHLLYAGSLCFRSDGIESIDFGGNKFGGKNIVLDGNGVWNLKNDINAPAFPALLFKKGILKTNNFNLCFGDFISTAETKGVWEIGTSNLTIDHSWAMQSTADFTLNGEDANLFFRTEPAYANFQKANIQKKTISKFKKVRNASHASCTPAGGCAFTITLTAAEETCTGVCDALVTAVVTGGTAPYTYSWFGGPTPCLSGICPNMCNGVYTVQVTDFTGTFCLCDITVAQPVALDALAGIGSPFNPTCNGKCDGTATVSMHGGTGSYTYSWTGAGYAGGGQGTPKATGLCAGSYTCSVLDSNGCHPATATHVFTLTDPAVLHANGVQTNVKCFGACSGAASVAPTGGTLPYTYSWSPGASAGTSIGPLCPGKYTCTVKDKNACTDVYVATITQPFATLTPVAKVTNNPLHCFGDCTATDTVTVSGGTTPYTYSWNPGGQITAGKANMCAGSYTLHIVDANGCPDSSKVTITQPAGIVAAHNTVNILCNGSCTGSVTETPSGGAVPYTYLWSPPAPLTTATVSNLCIGTYSVTITDKNGCQKTDTAAVTQPPLINIVLNASQISCFPLCDGAITATVTGGKAPYTYTWSPGAPIGQGTKTISSLCPNTYTLVVHDANGCPQTNKIVISAQPQLFANVSSIQETCAATCNGSVTSTPSGGNGPYTYSWTPGPFATPTLNGICSGTFTVVVTDSRGCTDTKVVTLAPTPLLTVAISTTAISCNAACDGTASASPSGGTPPYVYSWQGGQTTASISALCAATYTVTVTDAKLCQATTTIVISQPNPLLPNATSKPVSCAGSCNGQVNSAPTGGTPAYTYSWSPGGQTTANVAGQCTGNYTVSITDAHGCNSQQTVFVNTPAFVNPGSVATNISCSGLCNGNITTSATGGAGGTYTYSWSPGGQSTTGLSFLCPGNYTVTVTDSNNCKGSTISNISQPTVLNATLIGTTSTCGNCQGTASVGVSGGTPGYVFSWSTFPSQTNPTATNLCVGTDSVLVTDAHGCTSKVIANVVQTVFISITTNPTVVSCFSACDGQATASAAGGLAPYTYSWNPTGQTPSGNAINLCAGTYTVTAHDANGCFNTDTVSFSNPPILKPVVTKTNATCHGLCNGSASVTVTGGSGVYTYSWSTVPSQSTASIVNVCAGTYTLTVTDGHSCDSVIQVIINQPPPILQTPTLTNPSTCVSCDGAISLNPSGGSSPYTYSWAGLQTTSSINNLCSGNYTVKVTDNIGCDSIHVYTLNSPTGPSASIHLVPTSCFGVCDGRDTAIVTGGSPPYTYTWTGVGVPNPGGGAASAVATGLCAGVYDLQVTDKIGCVKHVDSLTVSPSVLVFTPVITNVSCGGAHDGSIAVTVTGGTPIGMAGYIYSWSPVPGAGAVLSGLSPGNYTLSVTDAHNCPLSATYPITQPAILGITLTPTNVTCNGKCDGADTALVTGGSTPYSYSWSNGAITSKIVNLCPATYTANITDANGCKVSLSNSISQPSALVSSIVSTNADCFGACDGSAIGKAIGGTPPYSFTWAPGSQVTDTIKGLCAGSYSTTAMDFQGCTSVTSVIISEPAVIAIVLTPQNVTCNGASNGSASSAVSGGTGTYTYSWSPTGGIGPVGFGLAAGTYTLTVTDKKGCTGSQTVIITEPVKLLSNASAINPTCTGRCDGTATANPVGGTGPFIYSWSTSPIQTTIGIANLCGGTYTVETTDKNGCTNTQPVTVTDPAPISAGSAVAPANCGICNGTINVTPSGGTLPYTYLWTPAGVAGQGTASASALCAGNYVCKITDVNGCTDNITPLIVNNIGGPTSDTVPIIEPTCKNSCNGSATVTVIVGGTPGYTYSWSDSLNNSLGNITPSINNVCAGGYIIQVTDFKGCVYSQPVHIGSPKPFVPNVTIIQNSCTGVCNGSLMLAPTGGTGAYTYSWSNALPPFPTQNNLCSGSYTVKITDANGCDSIFTFSVNPLTVLLASTTHINPSCNAPCSGSATIIMASGTAPYSYSWTDPLGQIANTATNLCGGTYTVTAMDNLGCTIQQSTTLNTPNTLTATEVITAPTCGSCNGAATITPAGGTVPYTYQWSSGSATATDINLCAGLYSVNLTDSAGCKGSFSFPVNNSSGPTASTLAIKNIICSGTCNGSAVATPHGGTAPYSFNWLPGSQTADSISSQCAGLYFVQVTDAAGCVRTDSVPIISASVFQLNQVVNPTNCQFCTGSITLSPSGGVAPYTYSWSGGLPPTASQTALCTGTDTATITDAIGCAHQYIFAVNSLNGPSIANTTVNVLCHGICSGSDTVVASGGGGGPYTYLWIPAPGAGQGTNIASGLCAGNYTVQVSNAAGCANSSSIVITEPASLSFAGPQIHNVLCNGVCIGKAVAIVTGGISPYTYSWSPGTSVTKIDSAMCAGIYTISVTDSKGCTKNDVITITQPTALAFTNTLTNPPCDNAPGGSISVSPLGGTTPYTYSWTGPGAFTSVTQNLINVLGGAYVLGVTDSNGCKQTLHDTLKPVISLEANAGPNLTFCNSGSLKLNGAASINANTYAWYQMPGFVPIGAGSSVTVSPPNGTTTYDLIITNSTCTDTASLQVNSAPAPVVHAGVSQTIATNSSTILGGNPTCVTGVSYNWTPASGITDTTNSNPEVIPPSTTTYTVTVKDANGCTGSDTITIILLPELSFSNGITPNGDGANDLWVIDKITLFPNNVVEIYNRWGELLFQAKNYQNNWDGTYKGKDLPVGTYYFIIDLHDPKFKTKYTGPITIMR